LPKASDAVRSGASRSETCPDRRRYVIDLGPRRFLASLGRDPKDLDEEEGIMRRRLPFIILLSLVASTAFSGPVFSAQGRHCAIRLVPIDRRGSINIAEAQLIGCYGSLSEALAAGSDGRIRVSSTEDPLHLTDADVRTGTRAGDVLIGTEFNVTGYSGASNDYFAASTCSSTNIWELNYVGDTWNDMFSSGKGFGGCDHNKKFQHADFGGNVLTCTPNCTDYGLLSNNVSSLRWRP
jgi:hypothetical protein